MLQGARRCHRTCDSGCEDATGCEAMPSHMRFRVRGCYRVRGMPSDDRSGARDGYRVRGMPSHVRGDAIARAIWRCAMPPAPNVIPCRLPWQPQRGISWACHGMIAWAHEADIGCEAMPPAPGVIPCRLPWQPQRGISLACHRMIDRAHAVAIGCEACHRTYVRGDAIARAIWRCAIYLSSQRGISLACHRMIARAHEADIGCEAMPSHVRFSARHASHMRTESPWLAVG